MNLNGSGAIQDHISAEQSIRRNLAVSTVSILNSSDNPMAGNAIILTALVATKGLRDLCLSRTLYRIRVEVSRLPRIATGFR
jgi:hypothetical protein